MRYRLFGLSIESELLLPEMAREPVDGEGGPPDLSIRLGDTPDGASRGYILNIDEVARFIITDGRSITITPAERAGEREIRLFLLGSAMGAALHQRGILPIHANAVEIDGRAMAFMGPSGAGKSTLAAWFHDQGYRILADDVCVIRADEREGAVAYPGLPRLRLWQDALEASGRATADHVPSFHGSADERQKYDVPIAPAGAASDPLRLAALFVLESGCELSIERLGGSLAVGAISANTYRGRLIQQVGDPKAHFAACIAIARTTPVLKLSRPFDRNRFAAQCAAILDYCRSRLPSG